MKVSVWRLSGMCLQCVPQATSMSSPLLQRYIIRQRQANGKASNTTLTTRHISNGLFLITTDDNLLHYFCQAHTQTFNAPADTKLLATLLTFNLKISGPEILCMGCNFVCQSYNIFWWCLPPSRDLNLIWSQKMSCSVEGAESVNISFQCHYERGLGTEGKLEDMERTGAGRLRIRHWMFW